MSCCACSETPSRITNLFKDDNLLSKFIELTGIYINCNTFICDPCVDKLLSYYIFKEKCLEIYERTNGTEIFSSSIGEDIIIYDNDEEEYIDFNLSTKNKTTNNEYDNERESINSIEEKPEDDLIFKCPSKRKNYSKEFREEVISRANETSNRQAAREYAVDESNIRKWIKQDGCNSNIKYDLNHSNEIEHLEETHLTEYDVTADNEESERFETSSRHIKNRKSYSSKQKLEAVSYAEKLGNRKASKLFHIDESCIRKWRKTKDLLIKINNERGTKRKPNLHWPELDAELKAWAISEINLGNRIKPAHLKAKSIELAKAFNFHDFKGTSSFIFKFMKRYNLPSREIKQSISSKKLIIQRLKTP
ncbi:CLUMA_CG018216, isoform A [Clunio marinus]|uniref:CLUMA_CG018216, isoform A n=1 Tax=Clunio marinus TaxID=568069 RepID=A0A1J1J0R0_9DIPT|nr:CLUMA_CG018216, isoform A [Clunio marinus]